VVALELAHRGEQAVVLEPLRRQQALRAVAERDHVAPGTCRGEDLRQGDVVLLAVVAGELHVATQLEPVDARSDRQARRPGGADELLVGQHRPAPLDQLGRDGRHHLAGQQHRVARSRRDVTQAQRHARVDRHALGPSVAADQPGAAFFKLLVIDHLLSNRNAGARVQLGLVAVTVAGGV